MYCEAKFAHKVTLVKHIEKVHSELYMEKVLGLDVSESPKMEIANEDQEVSEYLEIENPALFCKTELQDVV